MNTIPLRPNLLLVDDEPTVLASINDSLRQEYKTRVATNGQRAIELAQTLPLPDLILLDIEMPLLDGYKVCQTLKNLPLTRDIPIIFLSGHSDTVDITKGLELGAVDYVAKPIIVPILQARIRTHLRLQEAKAQLVLHNNELENQVAERTASLRERTEEVQHAQEMTVIALGALAETRDNETGNHIHRTQGYVKILTECLLRRPSYQGNYDEHYFSLIWKSAPLHDIGKVGIPDAILLKPGPLTFEEFQIMKQHPLLGKNAILLTKNRTQFQNKFMDIAAEVIYCHHEKWNGRGYPEGLSGQAIPLPARLMAIADVYDALITRRVYKEAIPHSAAVDIIRDERGLHFDPDLVDCFLESATEFHAIAQTYADL